MKAGRDLVDGETLEAVLQGVCDGEGRWTRGPVSLRMLGVVIREMRRRARTKVLEPSEDGWDLAQVDEEAGVDEEVQLIRVGSKHNAPSAEPRARVGVGEVRKTDVADG